MKKITGLLVISAMLAFVFGAIPVSASAQSMGDAPAVTVPPPVVPPEASSPASTELLPLSAISDSPEAEPVRATKSKHKSSHSSHKSKHRKKSKHSSPGALGEHTRIRTTQISLTQLGYRPGNADGVMGPKTKAALKSFQRDHHLKADGILGPVTYAALMRETGSQNPMRSSTAPPENFFATHPDYYGYYGADYANPTSFGSPQMIPNRFGNLELDMQQSGQAYNYALMLNGQAVFHANNQPSAINVSRTFNIGNADAVVLTSYGAGDGVCPYRHYVLVVRQNSNGLHPIDNCTRNYEAFTEQGTLFISFPGDSHNGVNEGAMWRYENGTLEKL